MFYLTSDITIRSPLDLLDTAEAVARALQIPSFSRDESGRWEDQEIFVSACLGLRFAFGKAVDGQEGEYGLSIDSSTDAVDYDGTEKEVDATEYVLLLLRRSAALEAKRG